MSKSDAKRLKATAKKIGSKKDIENRMNQKSATDLIVETANAVAIESATALICAVLKKPEAEALLLKSAASMTLFQDLIAPLPQHVQSDIMDDIKREINYLVIEYSRQCLDNHNCIV